MQLKIWDSEGSNEKYFQLFCSSYKADQQHLALIQSLSLVRYLIPMRLQQVNTLFSKGLANCNNVPIKIFRLVEIRTLNFIPLSYFGQGERVHKITVINSY